MFDAEKLSAARWSVRDILQYLKNNHRVKRTHVEKAVRCLNEAGFEVSAKMLEAEFRPVFQGKKITTELSSSIQSLYDGVDAAISVRMNDEAHAIISQRRINQQTVANSNGNPQSDGGLVMPSSKPENPTKIDNNFDAAHVREQLQHYVKMPAFRLYVKEQITQWELWHRSHTEEINEHEGLRDKFHQELKELQGRDLPHSDDPADFDQLGSAEHCYEFHRDVAAWLKDDPEYKLVADREPVLFKEASVAAIVALFWCDINQSTLLVPEYDFLEPEGPFIEYLREQWQNPIQARYKYIHWFVEEATNAYESRIANDRVDAAISLRISDIAGTELKSDQQSNQNPSEFETAGLETVTTADIGTKNSTNPKEQEVSLCETATDAQQCEVLKGPAENPKEREVVLSETATVAQPCEVLKEPADPPKQLATKSEQDAALKPNEKAKVERNDWLLEMRGMDHKPKMTENELSNELLKECENKPNWVPIEPRSIAAALREAYKRQTGNLWPFDGRGRAKKTGK